VDQPGIVTADETESEEVLGTSVGDASTYFVTVVKIVTISSPEVSVPMGETDTTTLVVSGAAACSGAILVEVGAGVTLAMLVSCEDGADTAGAGAATELGVFEEPAGAAAGARAP
jgi:hypothetical protein